MPYKSFFFLPPKTSENQKFTDVFRRHRKRPEAQNGYLHLSKVQLIYVSSNYNSSKTYQKTRANQVQSEDRRIKGNFQ